ncbi:Epidermal growth factor-like protein [Pseudolycoriella hygida]|uniref:Epidermal growth factor-like protein n=1 Tax=Pseudolycoriella hygida TaxID=35572 RepID=A0A9Q0NAU0_9DIPT|nr:Epidermal growth factor-like protein [Pseudolycoriella hygida]
MRTVLTRKCSQQNTKLKRKESTTMSESVSKNFVYISIWLYLVVVVSSNSDGFCTELEPYFVNETKIETFAKQIEIQKKCHLFTTQICPEYRTETQSRIVQYEVPKTRLKQKCCAGYLMKDKKCVASCIPKCINSTCTGPNQCTCTEGFEPGKFHYRCILKCKQGYERNAQTMNCDPVCKVPCTNGKCTKPDVCECSSGYHKTTDGTCTENECDPGADVANNKCQNGYCSKNGVCQCNDGFVRRNSSLQCEALCDACVNGNCVAPNKCECYDGFEWNTKKSECVPKCSKGCSNGTCVAPDKCACNPGFKALNSSICIPICEKGCVNSTCTEPNTCTCFSGYELSSPHICTPVCANGCFNGSCVEPNVCRCDEGFYFNETSKQCDPSCGEDCVNSECTAPDTCTCKIGFSQVNSTHCEVPCENCTDGYCRVANVCECDEGKYLNTIGECIESECANDTCENGFCSDGICVCYVGYEKDEYKNCTPICSFECTYEYCNESEPCNCNNSKTNASDDGICTNCTIQAHWRSACHRLYDSHITASTSNSFLLWNVAAAMMIIVLCILSFFIYKKYYKRRSYICRSGANIVYREDGDDIEVID